MESACPGKKTVLLFLFGIFFFFYASLIYLFINNFLNLSYFSIYVLIAFVCIFFIFLQHNTGSGSGDEGQRNIKQLKLDIGVSKEMTELVEVHKINIMWKKHMQEHIDSADAIIGT